MPAVQQGPDFVETEGVEVAHMGEALAGQDYSEQWAIPALAAAGDAVVEAAGVCAGRRGRITELTTALLSLCTSIPC